MNKSLFNISEDYLQIIGILEDDELTEDLDNRLTIVREELGTKVKAYKSVISFLESQEEIAAKEVIRIDNFAKSKKAQREKLEYALLQALLLFGTPDKLTSKEQAEGKEPVKRLLLDNLSLSTRRSEAVEILDPIKISEDYKKKVISLRWASDEDIAKFKEIFANKDVKEEIAEISKEKISKAIKEGKEVQGAIIKKKYSLTIK